MSLRENGFMPRRIPEETKQRAIRLVLNHLDEYANLTEACVKIGGQLGIGKESLRRWVRQAQIDGGQRDGTPSEVLEENRRLRKEIRELEEANSILRDAAVFFAGELGPRSR